MDIVQVKIKLSKEDKISKYISLIRKFNNSLSISEIKRRIESYDYVIEFDLDDYLSDELNYGIDEYTRSTNFLKFLRQLESMGAEVAIYMENKKESFQLLENWIHTRRDIANDVENHPD